MQNKQSIFFMARLRNNRVDISDYMGDDDYMPFYLADHTHIDGNYQLNLRRVKDVAALLVSRHLRKIMDEIAEKQYPIYKEKIKSGELTLVDYFTHAYGYSKEEAEQISDYLYAYAAESGVSADDVIDTYTGYVTDNFRPELFFMP